MLQQLSAGCCDSQQASEASGLCQKHCDCNSRQRITQPCHKSIYCLTVNCQCCSTAEVAARSRLSSRLPNIHDGHTYSHYVSAIICTAGAMFNPVDKRAYLPLPCPNLPAGSVYTAVEYEVSELSSGSS